jgi:hypothetical protein
MKFAEMSQEVQVTRIAPTPKRPDIAFTPGRRRANQVGSTLLMLTNLFYFSLLQIFREAAKRLEDAGVTQGEPIPIDLGIVYRYGFILLGCSA